MSSHEEAVGRVEAWAARFGPKVLCPVGAGPNPHDLRAVVQALREAEARATVLAGEVEGLSGALGIGAEVEYVAIGARGVVEGAEMGILVRWRDDSTAFVRKSSLAALPLPGGSGDVVVASREDARPQPEGGVDVKPSEGAA